MPAGSRAGSRSLIGVDVGSTHIKAALVTPESGVIHVALRATETHAVRGGGAFDRRRAPVGDILAWHDPRPERQAAWLERQIGAAQLFARTGLRPEPKCTLAKLLWLREHKAADFTRLRRWAGVAG